MRERSTRDAPSTTAARGGFEGYVDSAAFRRTRLGVRRQTRSNKRSAVLECALVRCCLQPGIDAQYGREELCVVLATKVSFDPTFGSRGEPRPFVTKSDHFRHATLVCSGT